MITLKTDIKEFTHIVHLADIQIRLTKRHDEYREVFKRLVNSVAQLPETTAICVVGDVVHSKLDLSPECVQMTKEFLVGLADLNPTIIVAGNHDTNLINKNRLDSLSPIVEAIGHPNLHYLKKTDLYSLGDVCFNNYSIFDDESLYLKGDKIPAIYRNEYKHFVCLFHGTVDGAVSEMGFKLVNKNIPVSFFDGHDIVLLGDIHKVQTLQEYNETLNKPIVHYCGSLIQQNHGEDLEGHGYSLWDIYNNSFERVSIHNDYGYFTIRIDKGEIKTNLSNIPKKARIRLSCFESLPTETKAALKEIKKITTLVEPPTYTREDTKEDGTKSTLTINLLSGDLKNRDHQIKLISEFLKNKLKIEDQEILKEVIKINDESNASIKTDDISKNIRWNPIRFEWENLFSFGEDNVIDFTQMKDVVGLFATNAAGKSSVFSSLSWCIFDKCERDFKANNIINDQKMSCRAMLEVDIGGVRHFIERTGKMDKKGAVKVNVRFWKMVDGKEEDLTGIERSDTNNVIRAYMGSYEDFLLTSLSVQRSGKYETSFIDLGDSGRKDLLAQFLGLNIFDILHETANKKLNDIISILKVYKNEKIEEELVVNYDSLSSAQLVWEPENIKLIDLQNNRIEIQQKIAENSSKYIKIEGVPDTSEKDIKKSIEGDKGLILHHQSILDSLRKDMDQCNEIMTDAGRRIKEMEEKDVPKMYEKWQKLNNEKNEITTELNQKITEARSFKEKANRLENYQFDPNCKFCVKNADDVAIEAAKANQELEKYKPIIDELVYKKIDIIKKIDELKSVESDYQSYNTFLKNRIRVQEKYLECLKKFDDHLGFRQKSEENLVFCEKKLEAFNSHKDAIINNGEIGLKDEELKKQLQSAIYEENKQNQSVRHLLGKLSVFRSKIEELKKKLDKVKEIEKQYKAYDLYVQSVCRDGIPYEVIASAVPHIEGEVNTILSQIVEFHAKFDIDGKNIIPYIVYDERRWLMSLGSGMEQFILSTAIRVALTNLSNLPRANFLVIDEGFGVLAAENLSTMQTLFHFLKTNFDFVIIVSHLDALRDMVDSQMEIKKENGFSKVNFV